MMKRIMGMICLLVVATISCVVAQESTETKSEYEKIPVKDLVISSGVLNGQLVRTYGVVDYYETSTPFEVRAYWLKGNEGGIIPIRTTSPLPKLNQAIYVDAIMTDTVQEQYRYEGEKVYKFYLVEVDRGENPCVKCEKLTCTCVPTVCPDCGKNPCECLIIPLWAWLALGGMFLLFFVVAIALLARPKKASSAMTFNDTPDSVMPEAMGGGMPTSMAGPPVEAFDDSEITIKRDVTIIQGLDEATIRYLPGYLEILQGGKIGDSIPLCGGDTVIIGRAHSKGKGAAFIGLDDPDHALSRRQVTIRYNGSSREFYLEHSGTNGTFVNGQELTSNQAVRLSDNDIVNLAGTYELRFHLGSFSGRS